MSGKTIITLTPDQIKEAFEKATGERILDMTFSLDDDYEPGIPELEIKHCTLTIDQKQFKDENHE